MFVFDIDGDSEHEQKWDEVVVSVVGCAMHGGAHAAFEIQAAARFQQELDDVVVP